MPIVQYQAVISCWLSLCTASDMQAFEHSCVCIRVYWAKWSGQRNCVLFKSYETETSWHSTVTTLFTIIFSFELPMKLYTFLHADNFLSAKCLVKNKPWNKYILSNLSTLNSAIICILDCLEYIANLYRAQELSAIPKTLLQVWLWTSQCLQQIRKSQQGYWIM